jgi:hypothetical protein
MPTDIDVSFFFKLRDWSKFDVGLIRQMKSKEHFYCHQATRPFTPVQIEQNFLISEGNYV